MHERGRQAPKAPPTVPREAPEPGSAQDQRVHRPAPAPPTILGRRLGAQGRWNACAPVM